MEKLNTFQTEFFVGSMLGDACLHFNKGKPYHNSSFCKRQSRKDKNNYDKISYMKYHFDIFGNLSSNIGKGVVKNKYYYYCFTTHCHPLFTKLEKKWYLRDKNGDHIYNKIGHRIKIVPEDIKITPLTLCIWHMDDGFAYPKDANINLCTHGFTDDECEFLCQRLMMDLNLKGKIHRDRGKPKIYIGKKSYFDFIEIIKPFVKWNCFQYKLDTTTYNKTSNVGETHPMAKFTEKDVKEIFKLKKQKTQSKDIAKKFNVSGAAVSSVLNGRRFKHMNLYSPCKKTSKKLTKNQINEIYTLSKDLPQKEIAKKLNVNPSRISRLLGGKTYAQ
jgi:transcriptional regulator with XRE-family HTH domain